MASETFAFNILNTNLDKEGMSHNDKVYWLRSEYERDQLRNRLRERPDDERGLVNSFCDLDTIDDYKTGLRASLIVGSIIADSLGTWAKTCCRDTNPHDKIIQPIARRLKTDFIVHQAG